MKKIILPTDFSEYATKAIDFATDLFRNEAVHYILVHAYQAPSSTSDTLISIDDILKQNAENSIAEETDRLHRSGKNPNAAFSSVCKKGVPQLVIARTAKNERADLIVMGTRGAHGIREFLFGSNTAAVIQSSTVPVLVIPEQVSFSDPTQILLAVDKVKNLQNYNLDILKHIRSVYRSTLTLVHVETGKEANEEKDNMRIKEGRAMLGNHFPMQSKTIRNLNFIHGLSEYLEHNPGFHWLVLLPGKHGFFDKIFRKSQTRQWAYHAQIPLLALKESGT